MKSELSSVPFRIVSAFGDRREVSLRRQNKRGYGVPPGGPFDRESAMLANALAGRPEDAFLLEIALGPVVVEALQDTTIVVVGGPDGAFSLQEGKRLTIAPVQARAYVTIGSGLVGVLADPPRLGEEPIRVLPAPQTDHLDFKRFLAQPYQVGLASNRVGIRLEAEAMPHSISLPSEPAIPGVIQLPPSGQPIILGPDGPTIGGYPKIAVVIQADLDRLGRFKPGDKIAFEAVKVEAARQAATQNRTRIERRVAELRLRSGI